MQKIRMVGGILKQLSFATLFGNDLSLNASEDSEVSVESKDEGDFKMSREKNIMPEKGSVYKNAGDVDKSSLGSAKITMIEKKSIDSLSIAKKRKLVKEDDPVSKKQKIVKVNRVAETSSLQMEKSGNTSMIDVFRPYSDLILNIPCGTSIWCPGGLPVTSIEVSPLATSTRGRAINEYFLQWWLGPRLRKMVIKITSKSEPQFTQTSYDDPFGRFELVARKIDIDKKALHSGRFFGSSTSVRAMYAQVSGPGMSGFDLQTALESIADFRSLPDHRKIATRLELLMSPGKIIALPVSAFQIIDEPQRSAESGGCGFISRNGMRMLGGSARNTSIQIRIVSPSLGIFKGMLTLKEDIPVDFQLAPSMRKVGGSKIRSPRDNVVVVTVTNLFPTEKNRQFAPWVQGGSPCASFQQTRLSPMVARVLEAVDVSKATVDSYAKTGQRKFRDRRLGGKSAKLNTSAKTPSAKQRVFRKEAWLVGVCDPTDAIPAGEVFVTGMLKSEAAGVTVHKNGLSKGPHGHCIFMTRSPCIMATDGTLLRAVTEKPEGMRERDWQQLLSRPLGEVIFPNQGPSLPERIAGGDLDGDKYYVCWDAAIVREITRRPLQAPAESSIMTLAAAPPGADWLQKAQEVMFDPAGVRDGDCIGRLYNESERIAKQSPLGMDDPDAVLCANAYKQLIDRSKVPRCDSFFDCLHVKVFC